MMTLLRARHRAFANNLAINGNQTSAYLAVYPTCISRKAAEVGGRRIARRPEVQAYLLSIRSNTNRDSERLARVLQWPRGRRPKLKESHRKFVYALVIENKTLKDAYLAAYPQCSPLSAFSAACRLQHRPSVLKAITWAICCAEHERQRIVKRDARRRKAKWIKESDDRRQQFERWIELQIEATNHRRIGRLLKKTIHHTHIV